MQRCPTIKIKASKLLKRIINKKGGTQNQAVNGLVVKVSQAMQSMKETKIPAALN
jgi:hypothetical protein